MTHATNATVDRLDTYCLFCSSEQWCALPALSVRHVCAAPELCRVPQCDRVCGGVAHVRNEFLAVVELDVLRGVERSGPRPGQLLVVAAPQGAWALLVDEVRRLAPLDSAMHAEAERASGFSSCVLGAASFDGLFVRVLDPNRLFRLAQQRLQRHWSAAELPVDPRSSEVQVPASHETSGVAT